MLVRQLSCGNPTHSYAWRNVLSNYGIGTNYRPGTYAYTTYNFRPGTQVDVVANFRSPAAVLSYIDPSMNSTVGTHTSISANYNTVRVDDIQTGFKHVDWDL